LPGVQTFHHVQMPDLRPATSYFYRVLPAGSVASFTTFPEHNDSCEFIVFGDTRSDSAAHSSILRLIAERRPAFFVHTGDLVSRAYKTEEWVKFFSIEDALLKTTCFLPIIGNHEWPYWPYDTLFLLPDAEYFYSVTFGNVHLIILDTEMDLFGVQRNWLANDLSEAHRDTSIDWVFVACHRPAYSSGHYGSQKDVQNAWCPLFEEYGVDIVFAGHDHDYERTVPINGVIYIVSAGGGAPLRPVRTHTWTVYAESVHHFCQVRISGTQLSLSAINAQGVVFDSLTIDKPRE